MLRAVEISGCYLSTPTVHPDNRGRFNEWFKASEFEEALGFPFDLQQANISTSKAGVIRGLHFADVPPGQAKFVTCMSGSIVDVLVDIRIGSPTFKKWIAVNLTAENRHSLYVPVGIAHGFAALSDATVAYLTSAEYSPESEHEINPLDPELAIDWQVDQPILSEKDLNAPALNAVQLPRIEDCEDFENLLRDGWVLANEEASE